ncbi:MAG: LacI family transcriptional regulator [Actinobacteria bacterium]|nr:LacI family transcriptional regulator [Actinomycetota bacterium]
MDDRRNFDTSRDIPLSQGPPSPRARNTARYSGRRNTGGGAMPRVTVEKRPSLHEIAQHAGVSVSTVSRFVNGQLSLSPATESRVRGAMSELGWSRTAKTSRTRAARTDVIGLVVPQIGNMYFGRIAERIVAAAEAQGLSVMTVSTFSHARKEHDYVELLLDRGVDAIVYAGNHTTNEALSQAVSQGVPVVVIDEAIADATPHDTVLVDDYAGAYQAVAHLAAAGHERIALVSGPSGLNSVRERRRGWEDALVKAGIDPARQVVHSGPFSEDFGAGALSHLLSADEQPTAVFAASDTIALGILAGAASYGLRIPADLSVVGFDDVPAAGYVSPRLTTVRTPAEKMAATAVSMVIERLDDPGRDARTATVPVALVLGGTVAPPAGA